MPPNTQKNFSPNTRSALAKHEYRECLESSELFKLYLNSEQLLNVGRSIDSPHQRLVILRVHPEI